MRDPSRPGLAQMASAHEALEDYINALDLSATSVEVVDEGWAVVDVVGRRVATVHRDGLLHGGNLAYMIADLHDLLETVYDASDGDLEDMYAQMWQWPVLSRLNQAIQAVLEQTPGRSKKLKRKRVKKLVKAAQDLYAAYGACEGLDLAELQKEAGVA